MSKAFLLIVLLCFPQSLLAAVAFDAHTQSTDTATTEHTPSGTPKGVVVTVSCDNTNPGTNATAVTYGGVSMTQVTGSPLDFGSVKVTQWFLGSSIPTGAQDVVVTGAAGAPGSYSTDIVTVTAAADVEVQAVVKIAETSQSPSDTLALSGVSCFVLQAGASGRNFTSAVAPLSGWTERSEIDLGGNVSFCHTYDTVGTSDVTVGWTTDASDSEGAFAVALAESSGSSPLLLIMLMSAAVVAIPYPVFKFFRGR